MQLVCILPFDMLCLSVISMLHVNKHVAGYGGLSEIGLCVFCELCQIGFLVVGKSSSVLL